MSRHKQHFIWDRQNETIQTTAQTNGSINLFDAGQGNSWTSQSIHPPFLPLRYSISEVYVTRRQDKQATRRGVGGWSKDTVCNRYLGLSQQIWSSVLTHSQYSSAQRTDIESKAASYLKFRSQWVLEYTGLFEMIVGVLTTCHTQYTWDRSICIFLFNRTTLQVFVTNLMSVLYVFY